MRHHLSTFVTELQQGILYATAIAFLALASVALLVLELLYAETHPHLVPISERLDITIAWIFLTDFFAGLFLNSHLSLRTYWRQNWLNLVSSIPLTSEPARLLRVLRVFRALRVIRGGMNFWFAHKRAKRNRSARR